MAKKAELIEEAAKLKLEVSPKATIADLEAVIAAAKSDKPMKGEKVAKAPKADKEVVADRKADVAKAGKRSEKAAEEAEVKLEKEARKEAGDTTPQDGAEDAHMKKGPAPKTRSKLERRSKSYRKIADKVEVGKVYNIADALELAVATNPTKFDASVEVHVRLGVDPRQADQNIRTTVALPHGTGKKIVVAVFAPEADAKKAKAAGADIAGDEDFLKQLDKQELNFDVLVATPAYMPKLGKYARLLGPKGLMPNPKSGTVAADVVKAVTEAKAGKVEYRVDKQPTVHLSIGKVSFGTAKLAENASAFFTSLQAQKPSSLKATYVKSMTIATTMGPGIKVENQVK